MSKTSTAVEPVIARLRQRAAEKHIDGRKLQTVGFPYSVAQALLGEPTEDNGEMVVYEGDLLMFIRLRELEPLCELLDCSPRWFLFGRGAPKRSRSRSRSR